MKSLPSSISPPRYFQQYDFLPISRRNKLNICREEIDTTYDSNGKSDPHFETGFREQFHPKLTLKNGEKHYESHTGFDDK